MRSWKEEEIVLLSEVDYVVQLTNDGHFFFFFKCWSHVTEKEKTTIKILYYIQESEVEYHLMYNWFLFHRKPKALHKEECIIYRFGKICSVS